jgi:hypothetical protein
MFYMTILAKLLNCRPHRIASNERRQVSSMVDTSPTDVYSCGHAANHRRPFDRFRSRSERPRPAVGQTNHRLRVVGSNPLSAAGRRLAGQALPLNCLTFMTRNCIIKIRSTRVSGSSGGFCSKLIEGGSNEVTSRPGFFGGAHCVGGPF